MRRDVVADGLFGSVADQAVGAAGLGAGARQALAGKRSVAEGYESAPAVRELAARMGVDMPISLAVAALLAGETTVQDMIDALLSRPLKVERE